MEQKRSAIIELPIQDAHVLRLCTVPDAAGTAILIEDDLIESLNDELKLSTTEGGDWL